MSETPQNQHKKAERESTKKKKALFLEAFKQTLGNVSNACKSVGIDRGTYYLWIEKDKAFKKAIEEITEVQLDFVETALFKGIKEGNASLITFFLKTKGKDRGYVERREITGKEGEDLIPKKTLTMQEARELIKRIEQEI